jgi:hypothetical protein
MNAVPKPLDGQIDDVATALQILVRDFEKQKLDLTVRQVQNVVSSKEKVLVAANELAKSLQGLYKSNE